MSGASGDMEKSKLNTSSGESCPRVGEQGGGWTDVRRGMGIGLDGLETILDGARESGFVVRG